MARDKHERHHQGDHGSHFVPDHQPETTAVFGGESEVLETSEPEALKELFTETPSDETPPVGEDLPKIEEPEVEAPKEPETKAPEAPAPVAPVVKVKRKSKESIIAEIMTQHQAADMWTVLDLIAANPDIQDGVGVDRSRARAYYKWMSELFVESDGKKGAPGNALRGRDPRLKKVVAVTPAPETVKAADEPAKEPVEQPTEGAAEQPTETEAPQVGEQDAA